MHITAIIPTYKPGDYLLDCLKSIEAQTFSSYQYEVIVILNGCKEPYLNMIENYQRHLLRIKNLRIIQTDLPGVSNARNIGIDNAKGDYITFIDDDDIISPSFFEGLIQISTPECVGCGYSLSFKESITDSHPNFLTKASAVITLEVLELLFEALELLLEALELLLLLLSFGTHN